MRTDKGFRERIRDWNMAIVGDLNAFPCAPRRPRRRRHTLHIAALLRSRPPTHAYPSRRYVVFVNYAVKIYIYCWVFKNKLMNNNENLFAEDNIKRFIIYNVVGDVLGAAVLSATAHSAFGAGGPGPNLLLSTPRLCACAGLNSTGGPLGFRVKFFFVTWYNLLMPGSITCPLIPGVSAKRKIWQSARPTPARRVYFTL